LQAVKPAASFLLVSVKVAEQLGIPTTYWRNVCLDVLNYNSDVDSLSGH
jgi:hypothetical protein